MNSAKTPCRRLLTKRKVLHSLMTFASSLALFTLLVLLSMMVFTPELLACDGRPRVNGVYKRIPPFYVLYKIERFSFLTLFLSSVTWMPVQVVVRSKYLADAKFGLILVFCSFLLSRVYFYRALVHTCFCCTFW
jgi:hypothetical protein